MIRPGFLDIESRQNLIELARDGSAAHRLARRANALVLLDDGMSCEAIAKVLLLDDDTIRTWYRLYEGDGIEGLTNFSYEGSACQLSGEQQEKLKAWVATALPRTTRQVGAWIENEFGVVYEGRSGVIALLHRLGLEYHKPNVIPRKLDEEKQRAFIEGYEKLLNYPVHAITRKSLGDMTPCRVAFVVRDVLVHDAPQPLDRGIKRPTLEVGFLPIRLLPTPPTCRMLPGSGVKLCVGRCGDVARDAEQGTEGVERIEPPVEAEGEFVEVGLQVLVTDPVMDAVQPRFQVCEDEMDDWQILLGDLRIAPFSDGEVFVAALGKAGVAAPVVGNERRARHNGALNEAAEQLRAAVRHDGEPNPPGIATTLPLVELGARLALANLHSAGDKNLIVDATAFAARPAASPGFIDFDVLAGPAADPVLIRAHHPRAELVEDLERRLVARQAKLSPKLHGRHAGCLAGHQIGRPKPYAQRRVQARHDRSHRQSGVTAALAAAQDARTICEAERLSRRLTMGANKPVAPASLLQVGGAGRVVGKKSLELWERLWEPKIATLVNVHEHGRTLPLVAVGDNRIGKVGLNTYTLQSRPCGRI